MGGKGKGKGALGGKAAGKGKGESKGKGGKAGGKGKGKGKGKQAEEHHWVKLKPTVCVTGCSGYLAGSVVQRLVDKHYRVRGTVRSLNDAAKVAHLKKQFPKIELFEADLLGGGDAYEKAFAGCKYVMHCASPFQLSVADAQKDLVDPALKGTETVMNAALKAGVERVVLTSSCAAVGPPQTWMGDMSKVDKDKVFTEEDWNTTSTLKEGPYRYSKTVAEKKAREIADKNADKISLACICPSFILGPCFSDRADGESIKFIKGVLDGSAKEAGLKGFPLGVVDVRDVSLAHLSAMEHEDAGGKRFVMSSEKAYNKIELCDMLRDRFKAYPIPEDGDRHDLGFKYSPALAREVLKVKLRPVEISMRDMANSAIRNGIVEKKYVLKPFKCMKIGDLNPESKGVNLLVSVVSIGETEDTKRGGKITDVVAGDGSAIVTLRFNEEEMKSAAVNKVVEVHNGAVRMHGGFIRVYVGKWGKVAAHEGETEVKPKKEKDMSATEFELVAQ